MADKLRVVKGERVGVRKRRPTGRMARIALIPREDGTVTVVDPDSLYALRLNTVVTVSVPADSVGYEKLD